MMGTNSDCDKVQGTPLTSPQGWRIQRRDADEVQRARVALAEAGASCPHAPFGRARGAARPWALTTVACPDGGYAELAGTSPLAAQAEAHFKLLNGRYTDGIEPRLRRLEKVVRSGPGRQGTS